MQKSIEARRVKTTKIGLIGTTRARSRSDLPKGHRQYLEPNPRLCLTRHGSTMTLKRGHRAYLNIGKANHGN